MYVHINAENTVVNIPVTNPAHLNANGIDKMPEPKDAFNKWMNVSTSLRKEKN